MALLFGWPGGDRQPEGPVVDPAQSLAVVKSRGKWMWPATLPVAVQWLSPPQSPWSIHGVSGSSVEVRTKKSWSLWNCEGGLEGG